MSGTRRLVERLWAAALRASGGLWWARRQLRRNGAIVVLKLNRVLDEAEWRQTHSPRGMVVRSRTFEDLAAYLARRCQPVRLGDAASGTAARSIKVAITFDGAWQDNYTTALPALLAWRLPATVFVCTSLTGCLAPFWPERAMAALRAMRPSATEAQIEVLIGHLNDFAPQEREWWLEDLAHRLGAEGARGAPFEGDCTMTWEEIAEMDWVGVTFGSHTSTHRVLSRAAAGVTRREIRESQAAIERRLVRRCDLFAYPDGAWSAEARQVLDEEGFRRAFTTERNAWTAESDPLRIPRASICESDLADLRGAFSPAMFEYTVFWKVWRAMRATGRPQHAANRYPERAAA